MFEAARPRCRGHSQDTEGAAAGAAKKRCARRNFGQFVGNADLDRAAPSWHAQPGPIRALGAFQDSCDRPTSSVVLGTVSPTSGHKDHGANGFIRYRFLLTICTFGA